MALLAEDAPRQDYVKAIRYNAQYNHPDATDPLRMYLIYTATLRAAIASGLFAQRVANAADHEVEYSVRELRQLLDRAEAAPPVIAGQAASSGDFTESDFRSYRD